MMSMVWSLGMSLAYQKVECVGLMATLNDVVSCELLSWEYLCL